MYRHDDEAAPPEGLPPVGYKKPPVEHRFKKGSSGNPRGRPPKAIAGPKATSLNFGDQPINRILIEEAFRPVTIREGDRMVKMPAIQALIRAITVAGIKGSRLAQRDMVALVQNIESGDRQLRSALLETAIEYKTFWENEIEGARACGRPEPKPLPHPDDIIVDLRTGTIQVAGPMDPDQKQSWDKILALRDQAQDEVTYHAGKFRRARTTAAKKGALDQWHSQQRIFDRINETLLPPRDHKTLKDRSFYPDTFDATAPAHALSNE